MFSAQGMGGLGQFLGGLFGDSGSPYGDAMKQYQKWTDKAAQYQNPFFDAGKGAIPDYQKWLSGMQDPSGFINKLMGGYQQSPWAQYQTDQAMNAAQNMGSASGLSGSTPLTQFAQQQASGIASGDMQNWLGNVLGINTQYGQGLGGLMGMGQNSANMLSQLYGNLGNQMGQGAYGQRAGQNQDKWNMIGGGLGMIPGLFF
jgi:hypothetical protein